MFYGRINESLDVRKVNDLVELSVDFFLRHAENGATKINILPAGEVGMKARSNLQQGADSAMNLRDARGWLGDTRENLEQRAFTGTISPNNPTISPVLMSNDTSLSAQKGSWK